MKTVSAAKISANFNDYLKARQEQPVLVTRNGKPVAVLLAVASQADADQVTQNPARSLRSVFEEADEQIRQGERIPHDQFRREVELSRASKKPTTPRAKKVARVSKTVRR